MIFSALRSQLSLEFFNDGILRSGMHECFSHRGIASTGCAAHYVWTMDPPLQLHMVLQLVNVIGDLRRPSFVVSR